MANPHLCYQYYLVSHKFLYWDHCSSFKFTLYSKHREDVYYLQEFKYSDTTCCWIKNNHLALNPSKCKYMFVTHNLSDHGDKQETWTLMMVCVKLFVELQCSNTYTAQCGVEVSKVTLSECSAKTLHNHLALSTEVIKLHTDCYIQIATYSLSLSLSLTLSLSICILVPQICLSPHCVMVSLHTSTKEQVEP